MLFTVCDKIRHREAMDKISDFGLVRFFDSPPPSHLNLSHFQPLNHQPNPKTLAPAYYPYHRERIRARSTLQTKTPPAREAVSGRSGLFAIRKGRGCPASNHLKTALVGEACGRMQMDAIVPQAGAMFFGCCAGGAALRFNLMIARPRQLA